MAFIKSFIPGINSFIRVSEHFGKLPKYLIAFQFNRPNIKWHSLKVSLLVLTVSSAFQNILANWLRFEPSWFTPDRALRRKWWIFFQKKLRRGTKITRMWIEIKLNNAPWKDVPNYSSKNFHQSYLGGLSIYLDKRTFCFFCFSFNCIFSC